MPVATLVNNVRNDGPELIVPLARPDAGRSGRRAGSQPTAARRPSEGRPRDRARRRALRRTADGPGERPSASSARCLEHRAARAGHGTASVGDDHDEGGPGVGRRLGDDGERGGVEGSATTTTREIDEVAEASSRSPASRVAAARRPSPVVTARPPAGHSASATTRPASSAVDRTAGAATAVRRDGSRSTATWPRPLRREVEEDRVAHRIVADPADELDRPPSPRRRGRRQRQPPPWDAPQRWRGRADDDDHPPRIAPRPAVGRRPGRRSSSDPRRRSHRAAAPASAGRRSRSRSARASRPVSVVPGRASLAGSRVSAARRSRSARPTRSARRGRSAGAARSAARRGSGRRRRWSAAATGSAWGARHDRGDGRRRGAGRRTATSTNAAAWARTATGRPPPSATRQLSATAAAASRRPAGRQPAATRLRAGLLGDRGHHPVGEPGRWAESPPRAGSRPAPSQGLASSARSAPAVVAGSSCGWNRRVIVPLRPRPARREAARARDGDAS